MNSFIDAFDQWELWGLMGSSFLASTLLPGGSEALVVVMQHKEYDPAAILFFATIGNSLGSMLTFWMGWVAFSLHQKNRNLPKSLSGKHIAKHKKWVDRLGYPILSLAWLPLVGDVFCAIAGWFRFRWWIALLFIVIGKLSRYAVVMGLAQWWI